MFRDAEVVVHSRGERGRDVPVVIIPGIGMSHRYSARLHDELSRSTTVLSLDLPGFGGQPKPGGRMTVPDYADAIGRALDERQIRRAALVGHSMGAQFAVELSRQRPWLAERLVLVAPVVEPHRRTVHQQSFDLLHDLFVETPSAARLVIADYLRTGPRWFLTAVRSMLEYRTEDAIGGVSCPVLVVRGENDPIARRGWCYDLAHRAPDGELAEIAGAAHVLQHTDTDELAARIAAFSVRTAHRSRR